MTLLTLNVDATNEPKIVNQVDKSENKVHIIRVYGQRRDYWAGESTYTWTCNNVMVVICAEFYTETQGPLLPGQVYARVVLYDPSGTPDVFLENVTLDSVVIPDDCDDCTTYQVSTP